MKNNIELQYKGFLKTHNLWRNSDVFELDQFQFEAKTFSIENTQRFKEIRLGKRVEEFLSHHLKSTRKIDVIAENIQIKDNKITVGELDFLLRDKSKCIHLEVIYKFYLYDPDVKGDELSKWIGPNRKDTLVYKLQKLKDRQLPLLYSKHCKKTLGTCNLQAKDITQQVCYKAQLFLPFESNIKDISPLKNNCISGFYLSFNKIEILRNFSFYKPSKLDWLIEPHDKVDWIDFTEAKEIITGYINEERSPMVWLKDQNNNLQKCFITFW
ncbi:DUF1853 family protein [Winogradskyella jejuensis]|uniref:DUF1853 domain-containing protein n=1 Tax=Winogradskyella jejuensis TaxID=1089305 RepID=A0A1M5UEI3_9FLAO|nr:DUF1853 family protein [Winogradskyella jejuensis]SHH61331.1 hypothetical protein SAMN05444148_2454 [Winogradskyella jejuensis]